MHIVFLKENKIIDVVECLEVEIYSNSIKYVGVEHGISSTHGVSADLFILDQCSFEVGQVLTDSEIQSLVSANMKDQYIKLTIEEELARKDEQIRNMQQVINSLLFEGA
jgi:hypothetical protein